MITDLLKKIKRKLWNIVIKKTKKCNWYPSIYKAYWFTKLKHKPKHNGVVQYFTAIPNPGAGIGHQMANWIAGYWFAQKFGLRFAHTPFPMGQWDAFLGLGQDEVPVATLVNEHGYKKVRIPLFDENKEAEIVQIKKIFEAYRAQKVVFVAEQDQFYYKQFEVREALQQKFYNALSRKTDALVFDPHYYNIAIHVRRGDITIGQLNKNPNLLMRWQDNDYFINTLSKVVANVKTDKPIKIYLYSQGKRADFSEFEQFENLEYCLDMGARDSFLHMVYADMLITSKSSFSYKAALLSRGMVISPENFWHGYPKSDRWILATEAGDFNADILKA
ncbi:hypothetical protein [Maribacter luteus]|uniref:Uncharacterized protein n=1 Tax=Maribacter luteus TaxID=2594478 RepID=A0A6I2MKN2_9FLAO|nr:hypothetical protein [Maribacter luteus]MRX63337.1 hypothetical protein [Maribacter luteus]